MMKGVNGRVILAGTPIGDLDQTSPALRQLLEQAQVIAAEDTRRLQQLLRRLQIHTNARVVSYFEGNEARRTPELVEVLQQGTDVVLVTDAGMPLVSDPGYRLVQAAIEHDLVVTSLPGPTAAMTALAVSGLATDRFCFEGFLPRKAGPRAQRLAALAQEPRTMVFYEAPHRLAEFLGACAEVFGPERPAAICRELTKTYEEVVRGGLAELVHWASEHARGEITVVIAGEDGPPQVDPEDAVAMVLELANQGTKLSAAAAQVATSTGQDRKELYNAALAARHQEDQA